MTAAPDLDGWAISERLLTDLVRLEDRLWLVIDDMHELGPAEARSQLELLMRGRGLAARHAVPPPVGGNGRASISAARRRSSRLLPRRWWGSGTSPRRSRPNGSGRRGAEMDELMLDGNAVAGMLGQVFAAEMTTATMTCGNCGMAGPVGAMHVFRGAGIVMRCPNCDNVMAKIVEDGTRIWMNFGGMQALEITLRTDRRSVAGWLAHATESLILRRCRVPAPDSGQALAPVIPVRRRAGRAAHPCAAGGDTATTGIQSAVMARPAARQRTSGSGQHYSRFQAEVGAGREAAAAASTHFGLTCRGGGERLPVAGGEAGGRV